MEKISVCLSTNNNYVQHMAACISSILKNKNSDEFINVYIIDGGISEENKLNLAFFERRYACKLFYIFPDLNKMKNCKIFKSDYISQATYYRLFIPELIPQEDRIIYLDCDIIVRKSLKELYCKSFNNNLVLGVNDVGAKDGAERLKISEYINAGVLVINSKQMREENIVFKFLDFINSRQDIIQNHNQDIINYVCDGRIGIIENEFNAQVRRSNFSKFDRLEDPVILHFISSKKPWTLYKPLNSTHWASEYFKALDGTPWEFFIKEYKRKSLKYFIPNALYPTGWIKNLIRNIFSIKNTKDRKYKIITILGLEIRIKNKK